MLDPPLSEVIIESRRGDGQLLAAAEAEGLAVDNPFDHAMPADTPGA